VEGLKIKNALALCTNYQALLVLSAIVFELIFARGNSNNFDTFVFVMKPKT